MRKRPFKIRSVCWEGNNTCRLMANQALGALKSNAKRFNKTDPTRERRTTHNGHEVHLIIHGVWRPLKGEGGLPEDILKDTDLLLVPHERMFYPEGKSIRMKDAELWDNEESMMLLREHEKNGRVLVVPGDMTDAELRKEIEKRMK